MQQRRLRPGDVLDDYCPRERRITDHAVVAMIDDEIKQTRCVSCDTEHEYKQGRVPPQRRKKASAALFNQVLDGLHPPSRPAHAADDAAGFDPSSAPAEPDVDAERTSWAAAAAESAPVEAAAAPAAPDPEPETPLMSEHEFEEGPVRRPLIRAQLPRLEGQPPPARTLPDFTVRQPKNGRGGNRGSGGGQRQGGSGGGGRRRGLEMQGTGGSSRFGGQRQYGHGRPGNDRGQGAGFSGNRADRGRGGRGRGKKQR